MSAHTSDQNEQAIDVTGKARPSPVSVARGHVQTASGLDVSLTVRRLAKTIGMALALTGLFLIPQFLIHIPTGIIAPISAGITTGGIMKVRPSESVIIGLTLFFIISLPAPLAYHFFGVADHLPFAAILVFSFVFGAYYGTLIGVFSWIGSRINQSKIGG